MLNMIYKLFLTNFPIHLISFIFISAFTYLMFTEEEDE